MKRILLLCLIGMLVGCVGKKNNFAGGSLRVNFQINAPAADVQPSSQMAAWLEYPKGDSIKTFFISEYLSYGGYNDSTICPLWSSAANWENATEAEYDARTGATLLEGVHSLVFDVGPEQLSIDLYKINLQLHIIEEYNILYSGTIDLRDGRHKADLEPDQNSRAYPGSENILSHVSIEYIP